MDDVRFISGVFLLMFFVLISGQMTADETTPQDDGTTTAATEANSLVINCTTSRGMDGTCVERISCDYNTSHIDLTMYAPKGYKSPCLLSEVCCPINYVVLPSPTNKMNDSSNNDDDDDDDDDDNFNLD